MGTYWLYPQLWNLIQASKTKVDGQHILLMKIMRVAILLVESQMTPLWKIVRILYLSLQLQITFQVKNLKCLVWGPDKLPNYCNYYRRIYRLLVQQERGAIVQTDNRNILIQTFIYPRVFTWKPRLLTQVSSLILNETIFKMPHRLSCSRQLVRRLVYPDDEDCVRLIIMYTLQDVHIIEVQNSFSTFLKLLSFKCLSRNRAQISSFRHSQPICN